MTEEVTLQEARHASFEQLLQHAIAYVAMEAELRREDPVAYRKYTKKWIELLAKEVLVDL